MAALNLAHHREVDIHIPALKLVLMDITINTTRTVTHIHIHTRTLIPTPGTPTKMITTKNTSHQNPLPSRRHMQAALDPDHREPARPT